MHRSVLCKCRGGPSRLSCDVAAGARACTSATSPSCAVFQHGRCVITRDGCRASSSSGVFCSTTVRPVRPVASYVTASTGSFPLRSAFHRATDRNSIAHQLLLDVTVTILVPSHARTQVPYHSFSVGCTHATRGHDTRSSACVRRARRVPWYPHEVRCSSARTAPSTREAQGLVQCCSS